MKAKLDDAMDRICGGCGMVVNTPNEYHPWAFCVMFKATHNGDAVRTNLQAVVEYGMKAERFGVSLEDAMSNFNNVLDAYSTQKAEVTELVAELEAQGK
jgi:hypothetical protein